MTESVADGFVGHRYPTPYQLLFNVAIVEGETEAELDNVANDFSGKTKAFVQ